MQIGHLSLEIIPFFIVISIVSINGFGLCIVRILKHFTFNLLLNFILAQSFYLLLSPALRIAFVVASSISSIVGNSVFISFGIALLISYSAIPIGYVIPLSAYSAIISDLDLHNSNPIVGFSAFVFKLSSIADKYKFILPANSALNSIAFNSTTT